jgi:hypothetical protein
MARRYCDHLLQQRDRCTASAEEQKCWPRRRPQVSRKRNGAMPRPARGYAFNQGVDAPSLVLPGQALDVAEGTPATARDRKRNNCSASRLPYSSRASAARRSHRRNRQTRSASGWPGARRRRSAGWSWQILPLAASGERQGQESSRPRHRQLDYGSHSGERTKAAND